VAAAACGSSGASTAAQGSGSGGPDSAFYKGKTLNITVANAPGTTLSQTIAVMQPYLQQILGASVHITYDTAPTVAAEDAEASQPADGLHLGLLSISTAQSEVYFNDKLGFDLTKVDWIGATENFVSAAYACGSSPAWTNFQQFTRTSTPVTVTGVYGGNGYLLDVALLKAYGMKYKMLTGYTSSTINLSCTRGDGNFHVGSVSIFVNSAGTADVPAAHPLLLSGKLPAGSPMAYLNSEAPTLAEFAKSNPPATEAERETMAITQQLFAEDIPTEATFAPAGVPAARLAVLRNAFAEAAAEPAVVSAWLKLGLPDKYFSASAVSQYVQSSLSDVSGVQAKLGLNASSS
jgi:hypothetical protein